MARSRSGGTPGEPTRAERSRGPSLSGPSRASPARISGLDLEAPTEQAGGHLLADDEDSLNSVEADDAALPDHYKASHEPLPENERPFGRYTLLRRLAYGGMGEIFLARQGGAGQLAGISKLVVIKRILGHVRRDEKHRRMFLDEARLQALLQNPHIVAIHDMGEEGGHVFLAMEHVHGPSWRGLVDRCRKRREHIPLALVCDLVAQAARGLSYAHNLVDATGAPLRIVHRDINPHNVLVTYDGVVKIIDFGIAKSELADGHTETGTIKGKFSYMSPEQSAAKHLDSRSDLFTLGICLYELAALENPFRKGNVVLSLDAIQREDPAPIERRRREAGALQPIIDRCLAKNRNDRFDDCEDLAIALERLVADGIVPPAPAPLSSWLRDRFADEIAEHVSILGQTGSANALALRSADRSDPSSLPRRRPSTSRPTGEPLVAAETVVERRDPALDALAAQPTAMRSGLQSVQHTMEAPLPFHEERLPHELTSSTPAPVPAYQRENDDPFDVASIADEVEPERRARAPWLVAAGVVVVFAGGTAAALVRTGAVERWLHAEPAAIVEARLPVDAPVKDPVADPVKDPIAEPVVEPVKDPVAEPVKDPVAEPVKDPVVEPVKDPVVEPVKDPPRTDPVVTKVRPKNRRDDPKVDKAPVPLVGTMTVRSDGFAVKGSRGVPLGGSTTLSINEPDAPYKLTVRVRADADGRVTLDVETDPWAILVVNSVGKGKTPQRGIPMPTSGLVNLELTRPGGERMSVGLALKSR